MSLGTAGMSNLCNRTPNCREGNGHPGDCVDCAGPVHENWCGPDAAERYLQKVDPVMKLVELAQKNGGEVSFADFHHEIVDSVRESVPDPVFYDLGCGQNPETDFIGLDLFSTGERIKKCDLYTFPWRIIDDHGQLETIPDESVDILAATHFLEHVPDFMAHFEEVYRVLKPGGFYKMMGPYYLSVRAFQDPTHIQPLSIERFAYLSQEWMRRNGRDHFGPQVNFEIFLNQVFYAWNADYIGKSDEIRYEDLKHKFNVADDIALILRKLPMPEDEP